MTSGRNAKQIRYNLVDMTERGEVPKSRRETVYKSTIEQPRTGFYRRMLHMFRRAWSGMRDHSSDEVIEPVVRRKPAGIDALCKTTKFNRTELKFMYQGFKQVCPTGIVNESTLKEIYAQFFPQGDASQYAHYVFKAFDQDRNGTITFQDFVMGLSTLLRGTTVEKLQWVFNLYDLNGDGTITKEEMANIIESIHSLMGEYSTPSKDSTSTESHAERVFQKLDQNKDGVITVDVFVEMCLKDENILKSLQLLDTVL